MRCWAGALSSWDDGGWCGAIRRLNLLGHCLGDPLLVRLDPEAATLGLAHCLDELLPTLRGVCLPTVCLSIFQDMLALWAAAIVAVRLEILAVDTHPPCCARRCCIGCGPGISRSVLELGPPAFLSNLRVCGGHADVGHRVCIPSLALGSPRDGAGVHKLTPSMLTAQV